MDKVENIRSRELARAQPRVFNVIAGIAAVQLVVSVALLYADAAFPFWRKGLVVGFALPTVALAYVGLVTKPKRLGLLGPLVNVLLFGGMMAAVEGPTSPMSPLLFHVVLGQASRHGFSLSAKLTLATSLGIILVLCLLPAAWFGPAVAEPYRVWLWAVMLGGVILSKYVETSTNRNAYDAAAGQLDEMREAILHDHAARSRALETIGAKVAHELKNPLTSVKALLQLMADDISDEVGRRRFDVLDGEVKRMQTILQDYLSFSRPLDELRSAEVDLFALGKHVVAVLEARAANAKVDLVASGASAIITGDEERLRAALLNVAGNALEATAPGGTVGIETRKTEDGACITVRDTGRGMSSSDLEKLGTPFFSTKRRGTGLGVVVVTATVRQHGGDIRFESTEGEGTTVTIDLPRVAPDGGDPARSYEKLSHLDVSKLVPPKPSPE